MASVSGYLGQEMKFSVHIPVYQPLIIKILMCVRERKAGGSKWTRNIINRFKLHIQ